MDGCGSERFVVWCFAVLMLNNVLLFVFLFGLVYACACRFVLDDFVCFYSVVRAKDMT